jgi:FkbM family methyltransferase
MIKIIFKKSIEILGYKIIRKTSINNAPAIDNNYEFSMFAALKRCIDRGININTVIDVGASDGSWTRDCLKILPSADYLLIEAQEPHKLELDNLKKENDKVNYILAAAGNRDGVIYFDNSGLFGGLASESKLERNCIEVPVIRIDNEIQKQNMEGPYLIKLDTHGFEVPILEGASNILEQAELVIIETYNYQLTKDSLKFYQMCEYMDKKGFYPIEMVDFMLRKYDNSFWQMDTFFIRKNRKEFSYNSYE